MSNDKKSGWGSQRDWWTAIGVLIASIGLLSVISSIWTPDAAASAATGFLGSGSIVPSVIILVVGLVVAAIGWFVIKPKA
jgi:hypothetical protein